MALTNDDTSTKKILVALPITMLTKLDRVAESEMRNRSDTVREAIRRYIFEAEGKPSLGVIRQPSIMVVNDDTPAMS